MAKEKSDKIDNYENCPVRTVLVRVGDKWSILAITYLGEHGTLRFNELHTLIGTVSQKMLTVTLKSLEADGLVSRKMYAEIPPRVEYTLTKLGQSLLPAMASLIAWAKTNMPAIKTSRKKYAART